MESGRERLIRRDFLMNGLFMRFQIARLTERFFALVTGKRSLSRMCVWKSSEICSWNETFIAFFTCMHPNSLMDVHFMLCSPDLPDQSGFALIFCDKPVQIFASSEFMKKRKKPGFHPDFRFEMSKSRICSKNSAE